MRSTLSEGCLSGQVDDQPVAQGRCCLLDGVASKENKEKVLEWVDLNFNSEPHPQAGLLIHDDTTIHLANGAPHSNLLSASE